MLNITHYQRNVNQKHDEVSSHASQNVFYKKSTNNVGEIVEKGNPLTLLVGMKTSTATMENSVEIPYYLFFLFLNFT